MTNRRFVPCLTALESRLCLSGDPTDPIEIPSGGHDPTDPIEPPTVEVADWFPYETPPPPFRGPIFAPDSPPPGTPPPVLVA